MAHLLVRHYHDDVHMLELLNEAVDINGMSGVLFLELIKRMEGIVAHISQIAESFVHVIQMWLRRHYIETWSAKVEAKVRPGH